MFIKAFKTKNNVQLKATEKKKFRSNVSKKYPSLTEDELNLIIPAKGNVFIIKILTHSGVQVTVYSVDKRPMFFELDGGQLVPTVYTLWLVTDMVPEFTTNPQVFPRLANGADLMLPGVVRKETTLASWGRFERDQVVMVNLTSNKAAIGVGLLARSSEDLYMSAGTGVCVKMLHVYGDKLWSIEPTVSLQVPSQSAVISVPKSNDFPSLSDSMKKVVKVVPDTAVFEQSSNVVNTKESPIEPVDEISQESKEELNPVEEMDRKLKTAFMTALKLSKEKLPVPLLTSNFYRLHVIPSSNETLDIKGSSYKKVSKFLDQMSNEDFIVVKEETKGVEKITEVNYLHPELLAFQPPKLMHTNDAAEGESSPLFKSTVAEMVSVTEETLDFFNYFKLSTGDSMDKKDVLKYIKDYLGQNKIKPDPVTKRLMLDEKLAKVCDTNEIKDTATLHAVILSKMDLCYEMRQHNIQPTTGKTLPIQMTTATRSGNKKITLISNLEQYGIILAEFAKACKVGAAASTSITRPPGSKTDQLQIQGNQVKFIHELLTQTYKIAPKNIQGLELAKKDKKKKK